MTSTSFCSCSFGGGGTSHMAPPRLKGLSTSNRCLSLNGHELEQTLGDSGGRGSLACCIHGVTKILPGRTSTHVFYFLWVPSQGHRSWPDHSSSVPTQVHVDLSHSLGCTESLTQSSVSVKWELRHGRCIFDVFLMRIQFCVFLLHLHDLNLSVYDLNSYWFSQFI